MAHKHVHTVDGRETSAPVIDPDNDNLHWHTLGGNRTSSNGPLGGDHTHTIDGETTSPPIDRDSSEEKSKTNLQYTKFSGRVTSTKEVEINGVKIGVIEGYIATWDVDRGNDKFMPGAFLESLARHTKDNRQGRFKRDHWTLIGGFPHETMREDNIGLFAVGHVNLDTQEGRETFALAKQGVLVDFSIGWQNIESSMVDGMLVITKAEFWEGSLVEEPMNPKAQVTAVKSIVPFQDMPLAPRDRAWDSKTAIARIREFTRSTESPSGGYKRAFVFCDWERSDEFSAYKLPIADIVNGKLVVVKDAVIAAANTLLSRTNTDIPEEAIKGTTKHIEQYCAKMGIDSPFSDDDKQYFTSSQVEIWTPRDCEKMLKGSGIFSKKAAKLLASRLDKKDKPDENVKDEGYEMLLKQINALTNSIK